MVPCIFSFILLYIVFISSFIFKLKSIISVSILITSVLNSTFDKLSVSSLLLLFLEFWSVLSFGLYFFVSAFLLGCKGRNLRCSSIGGNPLCCIVVLYVGEESKRE